MTRATRKSAPIDPNQVLSYWVARLEPLLGAAASPVFVCANRVGVEDGIQFTGCSCVIDLRGREGPRVLTAALDGKESIRTCLVPLGPLDDDSDDDDEEEEEEEEEEEDGDVGEETLGHGAGTAP